MANRTVLFDRFMSAKFLNTSDIVTWNCEHELQDDTHLLVKEDGVDFERVFRLNIAKKQTLKSPLTDLEFSLEIGLEAAGPNIYAIKNPLSWTVANDTHAIGIQIQNTNVFRSKGPYVGIEGDSDKLVLKNKGFVGENEEKTVSANWPRVFKITIKPLERVVYCHSSIDGGHLFTAEYDKYNTIISVDDGDLYLDVYRFDKDESYVINFVKLTVTMETN